MAGITSFGAYIPFYRLAHKEIARAWGGRAGEGERAVANVDEDSITMAVEAVRDLLGGSEGREIDGLMFATTTSPYAEKQASALIATAADLRNDVRTADYTTSLRSATTATLAALDSVSAGSLSNVVIAAADTRLAPPKSANERAFGDAASAIAVGRDKVIANLIASHSTVDEMTDVWRGDDDRFVSGGKSVSRLPRVTSVWSVRRYPSCSSATRSAQRRYRRRSFTRPMPGRSRARQRALG